MRRAGLGALLGIALAVSSEAGTLDDLARELPRIKPLEPAAANGSFRIHPGFHLEQVAAEPMVINPVSACYDADGRLYMVEMCGYPFEDIAARRPTALGRLHALWTLDVLAALPTALLTMGLRDPEARVREQAARLAERRIAYDPDLLAAVLPMADDPDPMVRFQVALTLGEATSDRWTLEALGGLAVRDAGDSWTRTAVLSSVGKSAHQLVEILADKNRFFDTRSGQLWLDELATLIGAGRDPVQLRRLVAPLAAARRDPDLNIRVLVAVNRGARRSGTSVSELLQADWAKLLDPLSVQATEIALSDASTDRRLPAIALLGLSGARRALEVLGGLLDARQPAPVQLAALQALGQVNDRAVGRLVVSRWKAMSPGVRREAAEFLFSRRNWLGHLLDALETMITRGRFLSAAASVSRRKLSFFRNRRSERGHIV